MQSGSAAAVIVEVYDSPDGLPADCEALFARGGSVFTTRPWWQAVTAAALPAGGHPQYIVIRIDGRAVGLFPMLLHAGLNAFTTPYTCLYTPLIPRAEDVWLVCQAFGRYCTAAAITRLDAIPEEWPFLPEAIDGFRAAGLSWTDYLAGRPGALRETVRRRIRRASRLPDAEFRVISHPTDLESGIVDFERIYATSWKEPEPFPTFNATLMRTAAAEGILRLGLWSIGFQPVAVQFWIMEAGHATVLKLAHDEAFRSHSPGTVLTAYMIQHMLDVERAESIDFGRGDDPYKQDWARRRRRRVGLLLIVPWRPKGAWALVRHAMGRLRARLKQRFSRVPAGAGRDEQEDNPLPSRPWERKSLPPRGP